MSKPLFSLDKKRIWVAGHGGMLGRSLVRQLQSESGTIITAGRNELDLTDKENTADFYLKNKPNVVIVAAAKSGGILAYRDKPASYLHENLAIEQNLIAGAAQHDVEKLIFVGSAAAYPEHAAQPFQPEALMSGSLDKYHESYGLAKIVGIRLCQFFRVENDCDFISVLPTNFYGPHGNSDQYSGHVVPSLMQRFCQAYRDRAPSVTIWGTGLAKRQFLHVDDCAGAIIHVLKHYSGNDPINIAPVGETSIAELAMIISKIVGYEGKLVQDSSKPDGAMRRALDVQMLQSLGWKPKVSLREGLQRLYHHICMSETKPINSV